MVDVLNCDFTWEREEKDLRSAGRGQVEDCLQSSMDF